MVKSLCGCGGALHALMTCGGTFAGGGSLFAHDEFCLMGRQ